MFATFFAKLRAAGHAIADEAVELLGTFFSAAAHSIAANGGPLLIQLAQDAVLAAETQGGNAGQKLQAAVDLVKAGLTAKGEPIVTNAIHLAIEASVAQLKAGVIAPPVAVAS